MAVVPAASARSLVFRRSAGVCYGSRVEWLERTWPGLVGFLLEPWTLFALTSFSVVTCLASVLGTSWAVRRLPVDYLLAEPERSRRSSRLGRLLRNALGAILALLGALMLVLPGQGLLTILAAISLMDFRGKRRLEQRIMSQPRVFALINRFRLRAGQPRLLAPDRGASEGGTA